MRFLVSYIQNYFFCYMIGLKNDQRGQYNRQIERMENAKFILGLTF